MMKRIEGFSLIEVLVAMLMISVAAMALARYQGTMTRNTTVAAERNEAVLLGQAELEKARAIVLAGGTLGSATSTEVTGQTGVFTVARSAPSTIAVGPNPFSSVQVTISWQDTEGASQHVVMQSSLRSAVDSILGPGVTPTP
ncbi:prepilin-type N-terminal cleavage/methylation domain-containing protein [Chitiniphilus purpureus]|uniref:Prepilin-type N-terminal cleavage/methylation domain-containing protein n=1 Tax=Chitiniphilus purpureus TaxID=2981137 RepID=A0ABY6DMA1_9NEIS|nr:prepilin-type N-terminal cleavage/methylation domain-containing protein [Chitiniphilus sp. CD1]UXY14226.1 prepilin-type N-terminal cleavage/methylation domain-containing protein [Chitiniphilus sp. CD1]